MNTEPQTLMEAVLHFADPEVTHKTMVELRWANGVRCPTCGRTDVQYISTRRTWECKEKHPKRQFSSKVGTIFEDSPLSLDKWFVAIWMIANCKNGVSSYELHRAIGVTQKSAWFMLHRIRLAMQTGSFIKSGGRGTEFEADEAFIGGKSKLNLFLFQESYESATFFLMRLSDLVVCRDLHAVWLISQNLIPWKSPKPGSRQSWSF